MQWSKLFPSNMRIVLIYSSIHGQVVSGRTANTFRERDMRATTRYRLHCAKQCRELLSSWLMRSKWIFDQLIGSTRFHSLSLCCCLLLILLHNNQPIQFYLPPNKSIRKPNWSRSFSIFLAPSNRGHLYNIRSAYTKNGVWSTFAVKSKKNELPSHFDIYIYMYIRMRMLHVIVCKLHIRAYARAIFH